MHLGLRYPTLITHDSVIVMADWRGFTVVLMIIPAMQVLEFDPRGGTHVSESLTTLNLRGGGGLTTGNPSKHLRVNGTPQPCMVTILRIQSWFRSSSEVYAVQEIRWEASRHQFTYRLGGILCGIRYVHLHRG